MITRTKLDHWCESVLEAGWLAALIVAPMFFNVFSSRVFEPDKISLVRSIALIMIVAWLVKIANGGPAWLTGYGNQAKVGDDENAGATSGWFRSIAKIPFFWSVLLLIFAYLISTVLSVAPFVSWFGSYQRMQGAYSFLSYVTIAGLAAAHLRTPDQIRRIQHVIVMTSFPIAVYGIIQHNQRDPLPWGGDVTTRVAANAGNAIFLAAYLIMSFFFVLERVYASFAAILSSDFEQTNKASDTANVLAGSIYIVILVAQALAIVWTQSRGPWIGAAAGFYLFILLLFSARRPPGYKILTGIWAVLGISGIALIIAMNTLPVFAPLAQIPYLGRLTQLLDTSETGAVRILIWEGAADLMTPHTPLIYPDGETDTANPARQLVGYGPEAMWVAYNRFYPPDLAHIEARNASPDRSHNELWDSLVTTGAFGFIGYMSLFIGIFYWSLHWLGLIVNRRDRILFASFLIVGAIAWMSVFYTFDNGELRFLGVAMPLGLLTGLLLYTMLAAFMHTSYRPERSDIPRVLLIITILSTVVAHYAEIHFGISIAATKTYFWIETALLLTLGMRWSQPETAIIAADVVEPTAPEAAVPPAETVTPPANSAASKNRKDRPRPTTARPTGVRPAPARRLSADLPWLPTTIMTDVLIFFTAVFIYSTNPRGKGSPSEILFDSISVIWRGDQAESSLALFFLLLFTWLFAATLGLSNEVLRQRRTPDWLWWVRGYALHGVIVGFCWLFYGLYQAGRLTPPSIPAGLNNTEILTYQLNYVANHFSVFTWLVILWMVAAGTVFAWNTLQERRLTPLGRAPFVIVGAPLAAIVAFFLIITVNVALVRADIIYKQGQQYDAQGAWINSIELYRQALETRVSEDQYMLFLGRSLLEQGKAMQVPEGEFKFAPDSELAAVINLRPEQVAKMGRIDLLYAAEAVLRAAQRVNPLNTDHTANLARLYRTWADLTPDRPEMRAEMLQKSLAMYEMAVTLSPNAAHLWNERGNAYQANGENDKAIAAYDTSLELDPVFIQTYQLLADYYDRNGQYDKLNEVMQQGIKAFEEYQRFGVPVELYNYQGLALARTNLVTDSIESYLKVLTLDPSNAAAMRNLAVLYQNQGDLVNAAQYTSQAVASIGPAGGQVYTDLLSMGLAINQNRLNQAPTDYDAKFRLAEIYYRLGQIDAALPLAQQALQEAPEAEKAKIQQLLQVMGG